MYVETDPPATAPALEGWFEAKVVARAAGVAIFAELLALMLARRQRW
ncbi:hypothetical protein [Burkholderia cenocepacia]|nr:hypothetical protein [Burkholderia cenocepacia]